MQEKYITEDAPLIGNGTPRRYADSRQARKRSCMVFTLLVVTLLVTLTTSVSIGASGDIVGDSIVRWVHRTSDVRVREDPCPQEPAWQRPEDAVRVSYPKEEELARRLSGAIQIDTSVHDDETSPDEDPESWHRRFEPLHKYFETTYPRVHAQDGPITRELIHQEGLLYTWKGLDESLKPLLLMAHQDVVPVDPETIDQWVAPPFSGSIVNGSVVGRGATDIKNLVVSIMGSIEALLEAGFQPKRTIVVQFGYDEEAGGRFGAQYIGKHLERVYGKDSFALIVDEGNPVVAATDRASGFGIPLAIPGVEEKGSLHLRVRVEGAGGHSSMPPPRTTVGLLSEFVASLETGDNLREAVIPDLDSAYLNTLQCLRDRSPAIPPALQRALKHLEWAKKSSTSELLSVSRTPLHSAAVRIMAFLGLQLDHRKRSRIERAKRALLAVLPESRKIQWSTTQTPTVFHGGIKLNAIPTSAQVEIDHRVALHHTIEFIQHWYADKLLAFSKKRSLALRIEGEPAYTPTEPPAAQVILETARNPLPSAPRTPISGPDAKPWRLFQSLIRSTWSLPEEGHEENKGILVAPSQMNGNTDTRWMWALSKHIFRFMPGSLLPDPFPEGSAFKGVHSVNEHYRTDGLVHAIRFYADLIVATDADKEI